MFAEIPPSDSQFSGNDYVPMLIETIRQARIQYPEIQELVKEIQSWDDPLKMLGQLLRDPNVSALTKSVMCDLAVGLAYENALAGRGES